MLFTRTWIVLLSLAACLALGVALILPGPTSREMTKTVLADLDRSQHNAELMLRLEARDWIDTATKMARDRELVETLLAASDGIGVTTSHKTKLQERVLNLLNKLGVEDQPKLVIVVDANGKQIYRMGLGEDTYAAGKDGLIGYPLVEEALRGGRRDDTWNINGKLFMMAATPVISRAKGRYVGALLLGEALNDVFARRFKMQLGRTDIALFLRGKQVGATYAGDGLEGLPALKTKHQKELTATGRTAVKLVGSGPAAFYTILTPLPGEAGVQDAFYALIMRPPPQTALPAMLSRATEADLAWGTFPWMLIIGAFLAALLVGIVLNLWEVSMPISRMEKMMSRMKRGEISKLDVKGLGGRFGKLAGAVNTALSKAREAAPAPVTPAIKSTNTSPFDIAPTPTPMALQEQLAKEKAAAEAEAEGEPEPEAEASAPKKKKGGFMPAGMDAEDLATEIQKLPPEMADADPYDTVLDPRPSAKLPGGAAKESDKPAYEEDATGAAEKPAEVVVSAPAQEPVVPAVAGEINEEEAIAKASTVMSSIPETLAKTDAREHEEEQKSEEEIELDKYIESVFTDFIEMKKQCGENTEKLTLERFGGKLRRNRATLIKRFGCKTVKFQVYVKDGKAALKATPIKS